MKIQYILKLATLLVVLTSMSDCDKKDLFSPLFYKEVDAPTSACFNGTYFYSEKETVPRFLLESYLLITQDSCRFSTNRTLYSKQRDSLDFFIWCESNEPLSLNKKIPFREHEIGRDGIIYNNKKRYEGKTISGWVMFTDTTNYSVSRCLVSGKFEYTLVMDDENNTIVEVTNGSFTDIVANLEFLYDTPNAL